MLTTILGCGTPAPPATVVAHPIEVDAGRSLADAWTALDQAERTLAVAGGDCVRTCAAVAEARAAIRPICDHSRRDCQAVEARVTQAEAVAATTCDRCP